MRFKWTSDPQRRGGRKYSCRPPCTAAVHSGVSLFRSIIKIATIGLSASVAIVGLAQAQVIDDRLWGLRMIGVEQARQAGFTGAGVKIGVMDDGIQLDHPEFADRWQDGFNVDGTPYGPAALHGTHVAGTILGRNVGVAPGALLYGINWDADPSDMGFARGYIWGLENGVRIFNNSWGLQDAGRTITVLEVSREDYEAGSPVLLAALRESARAGAVQVFSTGNAAQSEPGVMAGLPYLFPELQPNWLAVTAVGPSGTIASYAERCGVAANWCLAAPGGDGPNGSDDAIWSSVPGSLYDSINGTSMATPHVTGAMAIGAEMFPNATAPQLAQLVLQTATDIGAPGIDAIYGWGLLNVGNMLSTIEPATAGSFANAAWSRSAALDHVGQAMRQRMGLSPAPQASRSADLALMGYASVGAQSSGGIGVSNPVVSGVWAMPIFGTASIAAGPSSRSARSNTAGFLLGADLIQSGAAQLGVVAGYTNTRLTTGGSADNGSSDNLHLGIYGDWKNNGWFVEGTAQATMFGQTLTRHTIAGAGGTSATPVGRTRLSGNGVEADLRVGHDFELANSMTLSPFIAATARWQSTNAARETGAGVFSLNLPASTYGRFEAGPGIRWASAPVQMTSGTLRVKTDLSYARLMGNNAHLTNVELLGRTIAGSSAAVGRDILRVGAHANIVGNGGRFTGFAGYNGTFQRNANAHTFGGGLRVSF